MIIEACFLLLTSINGDKVLVSVNNMTSAYSMSFNKKRTYIESGKTTLTVNESPEEIQNMLINKTLPKFVCVGGSK